MWRFLSQSGPGGSRVGSEFWGRELLFQRSSGPRSSPRRPAAPRQLRLRLTFCNFLVFLLLLLGLATGPLLLSPWRNAEVLFLNSVRMQCATTWLTGATGCMYCTGRKCLSRCTDVPICGISARGRTAPLSEDSRQTAGVYVPSRLSSTR